MDRQKMDKGQELNRRTLFIQASGIVAGSIVLTSCAGEGTAKSGGEETLFTLPPLGYAYNALEPHIDEQTMRLHHDKHHATYVKNLNEALKDQSFARLPVDEVLLRLKELPESIQDTVINNGGGHANHSMFWEIMRPGGDKQPVGTVARAIEDTFGSFDIFKKEFQEAGTKQFGSGWAWLTCNADGKLAITATANQDSPLLSNLYPVMGNDVWEHAYYLKYQNRRPDYLNTWWNVVNWSEVERRFQKAQQFFRK